MHRYRYVAKVLDFRKIV